MKAAFFTFGCRLNQYETESLADSFVKSGFELVEFKEKSDVYLINTCTVTSKSEQKARRIIKRTAGENPESIVIVTGCYAQVEPDAFSRYGTNVFTVSMDNKDILLDLPVYLMSQTHENVDRRRLVFEWIAGDHNNDPERRFRFSPAEFNFHSRAFLKIQDGCDKRCAYCRVCIARGPSVSLNPETVIERTRELESHHYKEIVITGINIDSYFHSGLNLAALMKLLLEKTGSVRFRFSSLDPDTLKGELPEVFKNPRICPHVHLSLQSFCDKTLNRMNRLYSVADIEFGLKQLEKTGRNIHISADIIAGFPGESESDFEETCRRLKEWSISRFHVFPFSVRPDTPAAGMTDKVSDTYIRERAAILREIARENLKKYETGCGGREEELLVEEKKRSGNNVCYSGTTGNYLTLSCSISEGGEEYNTGDIIPVVLGLNESGELNCLWQGI